MAYQSVIVHFENQISKTTNWFWVHWNGLIEHIVIISELSICTSHKKCPGTYTINIWQNLLLSITSHCTHSTLLCNFKCIMLCKHSRQLYCIFIMLFDLICVHFLVSKNYLQMNWISSCILSFNSVEFNFNKYKYFPHSHSFEQHKNYCH